jgi:hypothetical protein
LASFSFRAGMKHFKIVKQLNLFGRVVSIGQNHLIIFAKFTVAFESELAVAVEIVIKSKFTISLYFAAT